MTHAVLAIAIVRTIGFRIAAKPAAAVTITTTIGRITVSRTTRFRIAAEPAAAIIRTAVRLARVLRSVTAVTTRTLGACGAIG